jgi:GAF domain-containing protein
MPLSQALAEIASLTADPVDVSELVQLATDRACDVLASDGAVVLLSLDGVALEQAGSSGTVGDVDALLAVEGVPCRTAMQTGTPVAFAEERARETFPDYAELAAAAGIRRVLSVPLRHREGVFGTLSMVRLSALDYQEDEVAAATQMADVLAAGLVREQAHRAALAVSAQLQHALQARVVVEQAKGMVAAELHLSIDDALDCIRQYARRHQLRLTDVAEEVVSRRLSIAALSS